MSAPILYDAAGCPLRAAVGFVRGLNRASDAETPRVELVSFLAIGVDEEVAECAPCETSEAPSTRSCPIPTSAASKDAERQQQKALV